MNDADQALNALIDAEKAEGAALATQQAASAALAEALTAQARVQALLDSLRAELEALPTLKDAREEMAPVETNAAEGQRAYETARAKLEGTAVNGMSASEYRQIGGEFFAALKAHLDAQARLAEAKAGLEVLRARIGELKKEIAALRSEAKKADDKVSEARAAAKAGSAAVAESDGAVDAALAALGEALGRLNPGPGGAPISPEILAVISGANREQRHDFLTIPSNVDALDGMVRKTLALFQAEMEKSVASADARTALVRSGVATRIASVTNRLARRRLSPMRKAILSRSYVPMLMRRLGDPVDPKIARDSVGLADLLVHDLDAADGPLHIYCAMLANAAISEMRIDAPAGSAQRQLITAQLLGSI